MASKVYFMDPRSQTPQTSLVAKALTVFEAAGFDKLIKPGDVVAIKHHCGEWNNTGYLRPVYARAIADRVKALGGRPFCCDTTTMVYNPYATRATAQDILLTAERNGYTSGTLGCPFIVADGFMGTDDYRVNIPEGYILKEAYIAQAIAMADVLITLTHFKGHGSGIFGGSIKNLGIGAQSKRGKYNVHLAGHPKYSFKDSSVYHPDKYKGRQEKGWEFLEQICPHDLIHVKANSVDIEWEKCTDCSSCRAALSGRGIVELSVEAQKALNAAIADACLGTVKAVGKGKVAFINLAIDLTPRCDCAGYSDMPLVPNLGVFASWDPVAIDKACLDMARDMEGMKGSAAEDMDVMKSGDHKFEVCSPLQAGAMEDIQVNTGEIIGLGTRDYEIVNVPEKPMTSFVFPPDPRPAGIRLRNQFAKNPVFPVGIYDHRGFLREDDVDLEKVNKYYPNSERLTRARSKRR